MWVGVLGAVEKKIRNQSRLKRRRFVRVKKSDTRFVRIQKTEGSFVRVKKNYKRFVRVKKGVADI